MLLWFVILYWIISVLIGLVAALKVKTVSDFAVAGSSLPLPIVIATVFATWFGSEAVLGIPATFLKEGVSGIVADPFGSSMCLILVGLFFARPLYKLKLLTIGDFFKFRYNRTVELLTSIAIVISYLGWVGAQIKALGIVFYVLSDGSISEIQGMLIGAVSVLVYTFLGGMISVAITDFIQMIIIVIGLLYLTFEISSAIPDGSSAIIQHAIAAGKFDWLPQNPVAWIGLIAAAVTMMFGSIPQQDVFQRVMSSRNAKIAQQGSIIGGGLYLIFTFVPIFLAYSATLIDPAMVKKFMATDPQMILPHMILAHAPLIAQVIFFGALLSAIKSCASATLLAPSVTFTENILRPLLKKPIGDKQLLQLMRIVLISFTIVVVIYAVYSDTSIFHMVESAYKVTLVSAFIPLFAGLYWKKASSLGGTLSAIGGMISWIFCEIFLADYFFPPQLVGLLVSGAGMILGSYYRPSRVIP